MLIKSGVGKANTEPANVSSKNGAKPGATGGASGAALAAEMVSSGKIRVSMTTEGFVTAGDGAAAATVLNSAVLGVFGDRRNGGGPICGKYGNPACAIAPSAMTVPSAFNEAIPSFTGRFMFQGSYRPPDASSEKFAGTLGKRAPGKKERESQASHVPALLSSNLDTSRLRLFLSLAPGFSPVESGDDDESRFNGFCRRVKAAEAAGCPSHPQSPG